MPNVERTSQMKTLSTVFLGLTTLALVGCEQSEYGNEFEEAYTEDGELLHEGEEGEFEASAERGASAGPDTTRPTTQDLTFGSGGAYVNRRDINVKITAKDNVGITEMCLSNTTACTTWEAWRSSGTTFRLPAGIGPHTVRAWVKDAAGNISAMYREDIQIDSRAPTDGTVTPTPIAGGVSAAFTGFRDNLSGIVRYRVVGQLGAVSPRCTDTSKVYWEGTTTTANFTGLRAGSHAMRVCAFDAAGWMSTGVDFISGPLDDGAAPVVADVTVNGGAEWVSDRDIDVEFDVTDASAITRMCITEARACATSDWQDFEANTVFTLSAGTGQKTVRYSIRDDFGHESALASIVVGLDLEAPTDGAVNLAYAPSAVDLSWTGYDDDLSGIYEYVVVQDYDVAPADCESGTEIYRGPNTSYRATGLISDQRYGFRVCAVDEAGWMSVGETGTMTPRAEYDAPVFTNITLYEGFAETYDLYIPVSVTATDAHNIVRMCINNDPVCDTWQPYQTEFYHTLATGATGTRTVYFWLEDELGNQSATPTTRTITYYAE
jgi:hypothetical protein